MPSTVGHWRLGPCKRFGRQCQVEQIKSDISGTNNYLAPEAYELRRSNKIDIWSFGCIVCKSCSIWKSCSTFAVPIDFGDSIHNFRVETKFNAGKIKPAYIGVVKKFVYFEYFKFFNLKFKTSKRPIAKSRTQIASK